MKERITVLLTGAGGAAVPYLIGSLKRQGYRILAADMDQSAAGLILADKGFVIPKADDPLFTGAIKKICLSEEVDVIIPMVDEELCSLSSLNIDRTIVLLPSPGFIRTCLDKYILIRELSKCNIPVPKTILGGEDPGDLGFPFIVKPRTGRGSRDVELLSDREEFKSWQTRHREQEDHFIFQEYLKGPEYTVSVIVWKNGKVQAVVPKKIISKKGITRCAVTEHNPSIETYCSKIQKNLHADGPFNVQLRYDEKTNIPRLFEINPRYSTTVSLTIMAGVEEIHGLIQQACFGSDAYQFQSWKEGIVLFRHYVDIPLSPNDFEQRTSQIQRIL